MKSVIPAAGLGTRFLPATKAVPKELLPVLGKPTIQYVAEEALSVSTEAIIVMSDDKPAIKKHFAPAPELIKDLLSKGKDELASRVAGAAALNVSYAHQPQALGLGHAVLCARGAVQSANPACVATSGASAAAAHPVSSAANDNLGDAVNLEPFFVLLGDVIVPDARVLPRMLQVSQLHNNASVIAVLAVPDKEVSRYGIVACDKVPGQPGVSKITGMVEKPSLADAPSNLSIFGRYLLSPSIFAVLERTQPGAGGEIQLTDAMIELLKTEEFYCVEVAPDEGLDCGTVESWLAANVAMNLR